jgi:tRNA(Ile)-lysidine synthase
MTAVSDDEFASWMAGFAPFETAPVIAVAVSGGGDSMALTLLADSWARRLGGRIVALTIDHGLRSESTDEARRVAEWLSARGIEHHVMTWQGEKPRAGLQEAARLARYDLLCWWCRENGVLHLATAHNREDQSETFLIRLTRGSGPAGLAATSAVVEDRGVRILRPLLGISRQRLRQTLEVAGQSWIEDPSNRDPRFRRVNVRSWLPALTLAGYPAGRLAGLVEGFARRRIDEERKVAGLLAASCRLDPAGYADLDAVPWRRVTGNLGGAALARIILAIGGGSYAPRPEKIAKVLAWLRDDMAGPPITLGRCRFARRIDRITVCRESRGLPEPVAARPAARIRWDRRFDVVFATASGKAARWPGLSLGALGRDGWAEIVGQRPELREVQIPFAARLVLPAIRDSEGVLKVPHLGFSRPGAAVPADVVRRADFAPWNTLSGVGFCLAHEVSSIISSGVVEPA